MAHRLDGVRHKLARAQFHLNTLESSVAVFLRRQPYEVVNEFDAETGLFIARFRMLRKPPLSFAVVIGDFGHNLRSALDHLAWQLVGETGGTPNRGTAFPILVDDNDTGFDAFVADRLPTLPSEVVAEIRAVQPYKRGDKARTHPLANLNKLSNRDKHRLMVPTFASLKADSFIGAQFALHDVTPPPTGTVTASGALYDGAELIRAEMQVTGPNPHVEVQSDFPIDITFGNAQIPVDEMLLALGTHVGEEVLPRFVPFFPQPLPELEP